MQTISYKNETGQMVARMNNVMVSRSEAIVIAQKYMAQMSDIDCAAVCDGATEVVVSRATEWQKRNG